MTAQSPARQSEDRSGLTSGEALDRLAREGPNELPRADRRSVLRILGEVIREPMLALLLAGGGAYLLLGDLGEALILLGFATFSIAVTVIQETRTEHVLEALRDLSAPRALVIRDGMRVRVSGREVVRGDLLVLEQGDRIAADAALATADDLQVDESLLTGESVPVRKRAAGDDDTLESGHRPGGEDQPLVYSGSLVTRGAGLAWVTATGPRSEIGRIGQSLATLDTEPPRLRRETARIVRLCALGGGGVALLVVLLFGLLRGGWLDAVLAGIAIGMSMLPEEFPVVLTIFLAMGAWRIAQAGVLTRRAAAIETLGSATVLCTDKTGTLTENRMAVASLWIPSGETAAIGGDTEAAPQFHKLIDTSILASAAVPVDPMEVAFHDAGAGIAALKERRAGLVLAHGYGLRADLLAMSNIWRDAGNDTDCRVAAKGAPEAIATLCRLTPDARARLTAAVDAMAERGMRVLGVASASTSADGAWPESQLDHAFTLTGLIGLADPLRTSVPAAVAECRAAGIKVVMITGDYAATARAIAIQAGIVDGDVLTGAELAVLDDAQLAERLKTVTVFARIMPEQKLRIVSAFKADGEIVAMTGDGVNDAPSLKAAHIGVAMGKRGTDVAREASAIVLLDDDFGSIVNAVRLGRRIYDNIREAMAFIFAVHVPIAGLALLPLVTGLPILFGPIHIALLEMIIDPVCALVFEAEREEADLMRRKPRDPDERLFSIRMIGWSVFQGSLAFAMLAAIFLLASHLGMPEAEVRALTFFALVGAILALILVNRSFDTSLLHALVRGNVALRYVFGAVVAITTLILTVAPIRAMLKFGPLHGIDIGVAGGSAALLLVLLEATKQFPSPRGAARRPTQP
ncbi:cation-translocating P-type ATPase [Sphingomonas canadensis]|uniref:Cation-translocating P-type ATPase n=1 Tax=Sphingomonas canadensis TaxID=1219257 RepID=A0ABW3HB78_9SPHN|nr:cation-translocating P-type ATPase [Sphingomonas canadensis]MCW3837329.1 cation-translocating P-type ATPase [Sphingomonas canadensis]